MKLLYITKVTLQIEKGGGPFGDGSETSGYSHE